MTRNRAAAIWHRTRVGTALSAAVACVLWIASAPWGEAIVLALACAVAAAGVLEGARKGALGAPDDPRGSVVGIAAVIVLDRSPGIRRRVLPTITEILTPKVGVPETKSASCCG